MISLIIAVLLSLGVISSPDQFDNSDNQIRIYQDWVGEEEGGF